MPLCAIMSFLCCSTQKKVVLKLKHNIRRITWKTNKEYICVCVCMYTVDSHGWESTNIKRCTPTMYQYHSKWSAQPASTILTNKFLDKIRNNQSVLLIGSRFCLLLVEVFFRESITNAILFSVVCSGFFCYLSPVFEFSAKANKAPFSLNLNQIERILKIFPIFRKNLLFSWDKSSDPSGSENFGYFYIHSALTE